MFIFPCLAFPQYHSIAITRKSDNLDIIIGQSYKIGGSNENQLVIDICLYTSAVGQQVGGAKYVYFFISFFILFFIFDILIYLLLERT